MAAVLLLTACTGGEDDEGRTSALSLEPGQCMVPPQEERAEVARVETRSCERAHTQEVFAVVPYEGDVTAPFPGADALRTFAQGRCAQEFEAYVGVPYLDSSLYFTYLTPSPRSWSSDEADREVVCIVTTTGAPLDRSVKGSRL